MYEKWERNLGELQRWVDDRHGGLSVNFSGHSVVSDENGIPKPWTCCASIEHANEFGQVRKETYLGYGTTMQSAIEACHSRWYNDDESVTP